MTNDITERAKHIHLLAEKTESIDAEDLPLYRMYALLSFAKGVETTAKDVHDAWSAWVAGIDPKHRSLKPFADLSPDVQQLDDPYVEAIRRASAEASFRDMIAGRLVAGGFKEVTDDTDG